MYQKLENYYKSRIENSGNQLSAVKRNIYFIGTCRLLVFLATSISAYLLRNIPWYYLVLLILFGLALFLYLLWTYNQFQKKKEYLETSIVCDRNELKALNYDYSAFDGAPEIIDSEHYFSLDLDVFGKNSLFQSLNRTCTAYGKRVLIDWFKNPLQDKSKIHIRQQAVGELKEKSGFSHHFLVTGLTHPGKDSDYDRINEFVQKPDFISSRKLWKWLSILFPLAWLTLITLVALSFIPRQTLVLVFILTWLISESQVKKVNQLQEYTGKKVEILKTYSGLIHNVESETFESFRLNELQSVFLKDKIKASDNFRKLTRLADSLEQRANLLIHLLLNPLLLWDIKKSIQIEEWKEKNGENLLNWIKTLGQFDAYCSAGIFVFNHPDYIFPSIADSYFQMEGKELGHPLMNRETCVKNDINIEKSPFFLIITGANMAGKSTYLRTIGVNFLLTCLGFPVCAKSLIVYPAKLITSLRTSDSLNDNESYFFAELKRLKVIIDQLNSGEKMFIILDEILKGTNSVDKQKGSLALVQQLIRLQSCGIIATHDLLLGSLEDKFPENIKNYRFEADIKNDELSFSYQLREGVAQNMNASFLMKKMGITME